MLSRDYLSNYLKQHDEKTIVSANCIIKIHIVNIIKGSKFRTVEEFIKSFQFSLVTTLSSF